MRAGSDDLWPNHRLRRIPGVRSLARWGRGAGSDGVVGLVRLVGAVYGRIYALGPADGGLLGATKTADGPRPCRSVGCHDQSVAGSTQRLTAAQA
jgi:hypothetical protein